MEKSHSVDWLTQDVMFVLLVAVSSATASFVEASSRQLVPSLLGNHDASDLERQVKELKISSYVTSSSDLNIDDTTLGKLLTEAHREYADYRSLEGVFVSQSSLSVASDRTGKLVGKSNIDQFSFVVRNVYGAQNQFPVITQAERKVDRTVKPVEEIIGIAEEHESSSAQIRTSFNEQRKTIIAECCERVSHHELQAARAEHKRKILQEELWRQQQDFREVHQQNLTEMKELQKIPKFYLRYAHQTEVHRGSEHYYGIIWKITRIAK